MSDMMMIEFWKWTIRVVKRENEETKIRVRRRINVNCKTGCSSYSWWVKLFRELIWWFPMWTNLSDYLTRDTEKINKFFDF